MKPESAGYLAKACECLDAAKTINAIPLPSVAAKEAYLAAYHAAHAFVFENPAEEAQEIIAIAQRFVDTFTQLLPAGLTPPCGLRTK